MEWNDHMNDDGYLAFLRELLDSGQLDETAAGITRLLMEKGENALLEKQQHVFQKYVSQEFVTEKCT